MASATAYVTSSIIRTPQLQQQLQQGHQQQRQTPVSQHHGQQRSQHNSFQQQQHGLVPQQKQASQHHPAHQQQHLQQCHDPQQGRHSQQHHVRMDQQLLLVHQQQVQKQPLRRTDAPNSLYGFAYPCPVSPATDPQDPAADGAPPVLLSHNVAPWRPGRVSQENSDCLAGSVMFAAAKQPGNQFPSCDKPTAISPVYLPCSGVGTAGTAAPPALLSGRMQSKLNLSASSSSTLASSGSAISDASTSTGDGNVFTTALAASLDSSPASPLHFGEKPSATTEDLENPLSLNASNRRATLEEQQCQQQTYQQAPNQSHQQQQVRIQPLMHMPNRHPLSSSGLPQQPRCPRQQRGIAAVDAEPAPTARQLRYNATATPPAPGVSRFKHGSCSTISSHAQSTRPAGSRRARHSVRQQHDQRTQVEPQRQQPLPLAQQTHCQCAAKGTERRHHVGNTHGNDLKTSVSPPFNANAVCTGNHGTAAASSAARSRSAYEDLPLSTDDCSASHHTNIEDELLHRSEGRSTGNSCSNPSPGYMPGRGCETLAHTPLGNRLGFPPLPYLYYDLRAVGCIKWPPLSLEGSQQTSGNGLNATVRLPGVTTSVTTDDTAENAIGRETTASLLPTTEDVRVRSPLCDAAGAAAARNYPPSLGDNKASPTGACFLLESSRINRAVFAATEQAAKSATDAATAAAAVAAAAAAAAGVGGPNDGHRFRGDRAYGRSLQHRRGELLSLDMPRKSDTGEFQMVPCATAGCYDSSMHDRAHSPSSRPKVGPGRSKQGLEQQPTVTLPLLCSPTLPKQPPSATVDLRDFQLPYSNLLTNATTARLLEDGTTTVKTGSSGKAATGAFPSTVSSAVQTPSCKPQAGDVAPRVRSVLTSLSGHFTTFGPALQRGSPVAKTSTTQMTTPVSEACACSSSDHIGRGRGPGGTGTAPSFHRPVVPTSTAVPAVKDAAVKAPQAENGQRTSDLERTWLKLLSESEAVAEGKVRTCRSSAPIPPAVLLRAPEKLEGHVISSSSRDIIRPSFYSLLEEEDAGAGGRPCGTVTAAGVAASLTSRKAGAEPSCTRQRQVSSSSDATRTHGASGNGEATIAVVETLHLEKLLQSAIYGAVFRANLHSVVRTTRASKKLRQGDEGRQDFDFGGDFEYNSNGECMDELNERNAHAISPYDSTTKTPEALAKYLADGGDASEKEDSPPDSSDRSQKNVQSKSFAEGKSRENPHGDAIGSVELRSQVVAVKILSLSLQLNASPSLQEAYLDLDLVSTLPTCTNAFIFLGVPDFLSELKFYPYLKGHKNILVPYRIYVDRTQQLLMLIFPFAEFEDLFEVLKKRKKPFAEAEVQWICKQLLQAVLFLHKRGIAMRDLSLENVLICRCPETGYAIPKLTDPGQAVIADRESAAATRKAVAVKRCCTAGDCDVCRRAEVNLERKADATRGRERCVGGNEARIETLGRRPLSDADDYEPAAVFLTPDKIFGKSFRPPEVYQQCSYNPFKVDSFCMGWMTYYLLTKQQLFQRAAPSDDNWRLLSTKNASDLLLLLGRKNGAVLSVEGLDFVVRLLEDDPERRMTIYQALLHPFIALSRPRPVLADNLFPEDAIAQEQHMVKQRHFHMQLLRQKQSLLQLYKLRWGDQRGLRIAAATQEPPEKGGHPIQSDNRQSPLSGKPSVHMQQVPCDVAIPSQAQRGPPCQTVLRKQTQSHKRQTSHQQQYEHGEEQWQCYSQQMLPMSPCTGAVHRSSRDRDTHQNKPEQLFFPQQGVKHSFKNYSSDCEPDVEESNGAAEVVQEEPSSEKPGPTLLVQHSAMLRMSPPTPSTPHRWWSAGILPNSQEVPTPCGAPRQTVVGWGKQNMHYQPQALGAVGCGRRARAVNSPGQRLRQVTLKNECQPQFNAEELFPHTGGTEVEAVLLQSMRNTGSLPADPEPGRPRSGDCKESFGAEPLQLPQERLSSKSTSPSSFSRGSAAREEQRDEPCAGHVCQAEAVYLAPAVRQLPADVSVGLVSPVEQRGSAQPQCTRPSLKPSPSGKQTISDKNTVPEMASEGPPHKHLNPSSAGIGQVFTSTRNEDSRTPLLASSSETKNDFSERTSSCAGNVTVAYDTFKPAKSTKNSNRESAQLDHTTARTELAAPPSAHEDSDTNAQPSAPSDRKTHTSVCTSSEKKTAAPADIETMFSVTPARATTRKTCKEPTCETERQCKEQEGSGQRHRSGVMFAKTGNSGFCKGRRGPSSSSTETGSTAGENCGARSDSDYCVGARSNGCLSHYNRNSILRAGLDSRRHEIGDRRGTLVTSAAPRKPAVEAETHDDAGSDVRACPTCTAEIEDNLAPFGQLSNGVGNLSTCCESAMPIKGISPVAEHQQTRCSRGYLVADARVAAYKPAASETLAGRCAEQDETNTLSVQRCPGLLRYASINERESLDEGTIAEAEYHEWRTYTSTHGQTLLRATPATRYPSF